MKKASRGGAENAEKKGISKESLLDEKVVVANFAITTQHGGKAICKIFTLQILTSLLLCITLMSFSREKHACLTVDLDNKQS